MVQSVFEPDTFDDLLRHKRVALTIRPWRFTLRGLLNQRIHVGLMSDLYYIQNTYILCIVENILKKMNDVTLYLLYTRQLLASFQTFQTNFYL